MTLSMSRPEFRWCGQGWLKERAQFYEAFKLDEMLTRRRCGDFRVFEDPCVFVNKEDGMQTGGERGVDVALGAVADHPAGLRREVVALHYGAIGVGVFFGDDFYGGEVLGEAGALQLTGLLALVSLGHQNDTVARGQVSEGFFYAGEQLNIVLVNNAGKAVDTVDVLVGCGAGGQALITRNKRPAEAVEPIAVGEDGLVLNGVEVLANFGRGVRFVIEPGDEVGDGTLKVNVVFPERVVGVEKQSLAGRELRHGSMVSEFCAPLKLLQNS